MSKKSLTYKISVDDLIVAAQSFASESPLHKAKLYRYLVYPITLALIASGVSWYYLDQTTTIIIAATSTIVLLALSLRFYKSSLKKYYEYFYKRLGRNEDWTQTVEMTIFDEYLQTKTDVKEVRYFWRNFGLRETKDYTLLLLDDGVDRLTIPHKKITEGSLKDFMATLQTKADIAELVIEKTPPQNPTL